MPRGRLPTGRKPGRATLAETVAKELAQSKGKAHKALAKHILAHEGEKPTAMVKLAQQAVGEFAGQLGHDTKYADLEAPLVLAGDTPEEIGKNAVNELVQRMHHKVAAEVVQSLKRKDGNFIKTYLELIQYVLPKLSKQEVSGTLKHAVATFVPVEQRRALNLTKGPDGVHRVSLDDEN